MQRDTNIKRHGKKARKKKKKHHRLNRQSSQ